MPSTTLSVKYPTRTSAVRETPAGMLVVNGGMNSNATSTVRGPAAITRARMGCSLKAHRPPQINDQQMTMSKLATVTDSTSGTWPRALNSPAPKAPAKLPAPQSWTAACLRLPAPTQTCSNPKSRAVIETTIHRVRTSGFMARYRV